MDVEQNATRAVEPDVSSILRASRNNALEFTEREKEILDLWDQAEELRLERSLMEAQAASMSSQSKSYATQVLKERSQRSHPISQQYQVTTSRHS
jgi:hypothetical protein